MERLLDREAVAEYLGISVKAAGAMMRGMVCVQIGARLRVTESALERWVREHETLPAAPPVRKQRKKAAGQTGDVPPGMYRTPDGRLKFIRLK